MTNNRSLLIYKACKNHNSVSLEVIKFLFGKLICSYILQY